MSPGVRSRAARRRKGLARARPVFLLRQAMPRLRQTSIAPGHARSAVAPGSPGNPPAHSSAARIANQMGFSRSSAPLPGTTSRPRRDPPDRVPDPEFHMAFRIAGRRREFLQAQFQAPLFRRLLRARSARDNAAPRCPIGPVCSGAPATAPPARALPLKTNPWLVGKSRTLARPPRIPAARGSPAYRHKAARGSRTCSCV